MPRRRRITVDFLLITLTGNMTRYLILRPLIEADHTFKARFYPIRTWLAEDWLRIFPAGVRIRFRHFLDSWQAFLTLPDAAVIHAFETYYLYVWSVILRRARTAVIVNPDGALPMPAHHHWLTSWLRHKAIQRTDAFVPWSNHAAQGIRDQVPWLDPSRIHVLHPGIDLGEWPLRAPKPFSERPQLLFIGGDLQRKGAETLLQAVESGLLQDCDVAILTQSGYLQDHPDLRRRIDALPSVHLHLDVQPGTKVLKDFYGAADVFVLPTNADVSSWVAIEAMATGVPVVITGVGGIPDIVIDGKTGLIIPPRDPHALARAIRSLRDHPDLREQLVRNGRAHIEVRFNAVQNQRALMGIVRDCIADRDKVGHGAGHKLVVPRDP